MRYLADHVSLVLQPAVQSWLQRSGALSALPDAPVVPDKPRRRRRMRRAEPLTTSPATTSPATTSPATPRRPAAACAR